MFGGGRKRSIQKKVEGCRGRNAGFIRKLHEEDKLRKWAVGPAQSRKELDLHAWTHEIESLNPYKGERTCSVKL